MYHIPNQTEGSSHQPPNTDQATGLIVSNADLLTAGRIYLEDRQRKINEEQARLNMDAMQLAEMARQEAIARLQAEVASGEEARRKLEALRQGALASSSSANSYQIATYEPTPSTSRIVSAEEEQRSSVNPNANWLRNPNISTTQSVTPSYSPHYQYQYQTQRSYPQGSGQQFIPAQSRPQVPALAYQHQQRQVYPSQTSTSAQPQQWTQLRHPPQSVKPSPLLQNQTYSQQPQHSLQRPSSLQISLPAPATQSQSQLHSLQPQTMKNNHQARGTMQPALPLRTQTSSPIGQQSATRESTTLNQAPPSQSKPHTGSVSSVTSASASQQTSSRPTNPAGWHTNGPIANLANPPSDTSQTMSSNQTMNAIQTPNANTNLSSALAKLSRADQKRFSLVKNYSYHWLARAEVGATEKLLSTDLFIHSLDKSQVQIGVMVNNNFKPLHFLGWIQALRKVDLFQLQNSVQSASVRASTATPGVKPTTTASNTTIPGTQAPSISKETNEHTESLVKALNSAHEQPSTPISSLSRKDSSTTASPRTPADANKKSLARDVLLALSSVKVKRQREGSGESDGRAAKRTALLPIPATQSKVANSDALMFSNFPAQAAALNYHPSIIMHPTVHQSPSAITSDQGKIIDQNQQNGTSSSRQLELSQANVNSVAKPLDNATQATTVADLGPSRLANLTESQHIQAIADSTTTATSSVSQNAPVVPSPMLQSASTTSPKASGFSEHRARSASHTSHEFDAPPLFLPDTPSPSPSPPPAINADGDSLGLADSVTVGNSNFEVLDEHREKSESRKGQADRKMIAVEIPLAPAWVRRDMSRRMRKVKLSREEADEDEVRSFIVIYDSDEEPEPRRVKDKNSRRSQSSQLAAGEDVETNFFLPTPVRDPQELAVLERSISRLQDCFCKWGGCEVILCSTKKLGQHMRNHVVESQPADKHGNPILCRICGKHEAHVPDHVENHAYHTLCCPYEECDESFRSSRKLFQHCLRYHRNDEPLRASAEPFVAVQTESPPDTPPTLPSYMVVARAVTPHPISIQRHQLLGPWVLKNIMPPVDSVSLRRYLKSKHLGRVEVPTTSDEYEFLVGRSSHSCMPSRPAKIRDFGDLNSKQVSQLINGGMSFWQDETEQPTDFSEPKNSPLLSGMPVDAGVPSGSSTDELLMTGAILKQEETG
ncbi:hypothetical protein F5050DRAFT_1788242 [Lentinula boryana]|uniref:C2H2-type domain-containing protein n=1 Tax=Lentinula boryana TaxID=40481 RepID=A0ABQ8Q1C6_9AGAR|nr:hypothetical protein F5050DRAFT_1788242 [Lentinula boryana]